MKLLTLIGLACALGGCVAAPQVKIIQLTSSLDADAMKSQVQDGTGTIDGTAFMRQAGGGVVTCAGQTVSLIPVSPYAIERIGFVVGVAPGINEVSTKSVSWMLRNRMSFIPDLPAYHEFRRTTTCDAKGEFEFSAVKDGQYYLGTNVVWKVGYNYQGGSLMTRVRVVNGKTPRVIMSH